MQNGMHMWEGSLLQPNPMNPTKKTNICLALSLPILNTHMFGPGWNRLAFKYWKWVAMSFFIRFPSESVL